MAAEPAPGAEYFTAPGTRTSAGTRRGAYFTERLTVAEAGARAGYTRSAMASLLRDFRVLGTSLFGDVAAALREHGSATLDEHCCYFRRPD